MKKDSIFEAAAKILFPETANIEIFDRRNTEATIKSAKRKWKSMPSLIGGLNGVTIGKQTPKGLSISGTTDAVKAYINVFYSLEDAGLFWPTLFPNVTQSRRV